jgi:hypothetical protein
MSGPLQEGDIKDLAAFLDLFGLSSQFFQLRVDLLAERFRRVLQRGSQLLNALEDASPDTAFSINDHALLPPR